MQQRRRRGRGPSFNLCCSLCFAQTEAKMTEKVIRSASAFSFALFFGMIRQYKRIHCTGTSWLLIQCTKTSLAFSHKHTHTHRRDMGLHRIDSIPGIFFFQLSCLSIATSFSFWTGRGAPKQQRTRSPFSFLSPLKQHPTTAKASIISCSINQHSNHQSLKSQITSSSPISSSFTTDHV